MSKQERQDGARANTRDAKRRCEEEEEDRHARQTESTEEGTGQKQTKCVEEFNESPDPLNSTAGA